MPADEAVLSVLVPALNEAETVESVIEAVLRIDIPLEVILVDDGSTDRTWALMQAADDGQRVRAFRHPTNRGKGGAVRTGLAEARGQIVLVQDADLEQDPSSYPALIAPILDGTAGVVFGTRDFTASSSGTFLYRLGNRLLTWLTNVIYRSSISDMETGYKVMRREIAISLELEARGFEIEPEIAAKVLRLGHHVHEVPINYVARSRAEGKKITAMDGLKAIGVLVKYRRWRPSTGSPPPPSP